MEYSNRYSTKTFFIKRFRRTVVPFLLWSMVAMFYCYMSNKQAYDWTMLGIVKGIITYRYMDIYWFFMPLFVVYLSMPVLTLLKNNLKIMGYMAVYALVTISFSSFVAKLGYNCSLLQSLVTPVSAGFLLYPLIGYLLHKIDIAKRWRWVIYFLGAMCAILHCVLTIFLTPEDGAIWTKFKGYLLLPNVLYSASIFLFFKYNSYVLCRFRRLMKIINFIQPTTLGIYLIHMYFLALYENLGLNYGRLYYRTLGPVITFVLCALFVWLCRKTRLGRLLFS